MLFSAFVKVDQDKTASSWFPDNVTLPRRLIDKIDSLVFSDTRYPGRSAFTDAARKQMTKV